MSEIRTYRDLKTALERMTEEQLDQTVQVVESHPTRDHIHAGLPAVCIGAVDELDLNYFRSSDDNRRHGEQIVIYVDAPPATKAGVVAWRSDPDDILNKEKMTPIYPKDHTPDRDWTGPAQDIADRAAEQRQSGKFDCHLAVAKLRMENYE